MVKVKTTLNRNTTRQLNAYAFNRVVAVMIVISLIFIAVGVCGIVFGKDVTVKCLGIILIVLGIIYTPIVWLILRMLQKKKDNSAVYKDGDVDELYEFDDEKVTLTQTKGIGLSSTTHMEYLYFYKIVETPTHFLLYMSSDQCHIIPKKDIVEGTVEELRTIFTTRAPAKCKK